MSFINEALKKAQKEKDAQYLEYSGILAAGGKGKRISVPMIVWYCFFIFIIFIIGFITYSVLSSRTDSAPLFGEKEQPPQRAAKKIKEPISGHKDDIDAVELYSMAKIHHKQGNLQEAKRLYKETLNLDPGHLDSLNNLGIISINERDYESGRKYLEKAIRLKPEYPDPYYNLACLYAITGNTGQGVEYLMKAVSLDRIVIEWAKKDTDLKNLGGIEEFEKIINQ